MQPSSTRLTSPRSAHSRLSWRARLLLGSALCGAAALMAQPTLAQTLPGIPGAGNIVVSSGGGQPVISAPDANTLNVDLNAPRTVINWASLHVSGGDTLNFNFDSASDIVLNRTNSQIAIDTGGTVNGRVGAAIGGNIWFYSPQGVIVAPGAVMSAGGFVFAGGTGLNDANFANAADPFTTLRAVSNGLIHLTTINSAASASINAAGDVVLHAPVGNLNVHRAYGRTAILSTDSGSINALEVTATHGAAQVLSGGAGATVTQITGATGVTVSSLSNSSVGSATTTAAGDIRITSDGSASLTIGNSARDVHLIAPQVFVSTIDAARSVYVTGTTQAYVTNRIFAGDDIEITANGNVIATGAYLRTSGFGAVEDAHILLRSTAGSVSGGTLITQGMGAAAGDIILEAATTAAVGSANSSRDVRVTGSGGASLTSGTAARDIAVTATGGLANATTANAGRDLTVAGQDASVTNGTAGRDAAVLTTNGDATVVNALTAGDDLDVIATGGDVLAGGATLRSTGANSTDGAHVRAQSFSGSVSVGSAITEGTGPTRGNIDLWSPGTTTLGSASATGGLIWIADNDINLTGTYSASDFSLVADSGAITQTSGALIGGNLSARAPGGIALTGGNRLSSISYLNASASDIVVNNGSSLSIFGAITGRDITVTTTTGALTVSGPGNIQAARDLTLTGTGGLTSSGLLSSGGDVTLTATTGNALIEHVDSDGSIRVEALNGAATLRRAILNGAGSLEIAAAGTATLGADTLNEIGLGHSVIRTGGAAGTIQVASSTGDARVFLNDLNADLTSVTASMTTGTALIGVAGGFNAGMVEGFNVLLDAPDGVIHVTDLTVGGGDYTARATDWSGAALTPGGTVRNLSLTDTDGGLVLTHALTVTGDLTLSSSDILTSAFDLTAGGDVTVTAAGGVDLVSATAGDDISVTSTGGQAILRRADLTGAGAGRDLNITAYGDAVLGEPDYTLITGDNVFTRSGGSTGTARIRSTNGYALAHLDTSTVIDLLEGAGVDVTIVSGPGIFGTITALTDRIYLEVLDGDLTIGTATADNGDVELFNAGGDLTLLGPVHGGGLVHLETTGLLDGTLASLISSDGDLELIGSDVNLGRVTAGRLLEVSAISGDATVQFARAGESFIVASLFGNATLRGAEAPEAVVVLAAETATFGADDRNSITADNAVVTNTPAGMGAGLQVMSQNGDAVVNIHSASNGIGMVGSAIDGSVTVTQVIGDLTINEVAGFDITLEALSGALNVGYLVSAGGDYTATAQDFRGNALTPDLYFGVIRDVTITDTLGDLDLDGLRLYAGRNLTVTAQDGAIVGLGALAAGTGLGDGVISVFADGISLDSVSSDGDVTLYGRTGRVDVASSVEVGNNYTLRGADFSFAALAPTGARAGDWTIADTVGDLDFTGQTLNYGGSIYALADFGDIIGDGIISDTGNIVVQANGGRLGVLSAQNGAITATASTGSMVVDTADAGTEIRIQALTTGTAALGGAVLRGVGANSLTVESLGGDAFLGALTPATISNGNVLISDGATTVVDVTAGGRVGINLDYLEAGFSTIRGAQGVDIRVRSGDLSIQDVASTNGGVWIDNLGGAVWLGQLTANADSGVKGLGELRLVSADVLGDLSLEAGGGSSIRLGGVTQGGAIDVTGDLSLRAGDDITQTAVLTADSLSALADGGITLLGDNLIGRLGRIETGEGFAFNTLGALTLTDDIDVDDQTMDLRAGGTITQGGGRITAGLLTGRSVGGAAFGGDNRIQTLGDFTNTGGALRINNARALTFAGRVWSTGTVEVRSHGGMTFASTGTVGADGTGDAVVLASDGVFTNQRGVDAVTASNAAGRWLIYTQAEGAPTGSTSGNNLGGLAGRSFYGSAYDFNAGGFSLTPNAGNRFVYAYRPTLLVLPNGLTIVYNGQIPTLSAAVSGLINGDLAADAWSGAPVITGAGRNAGTYTLTAQAGTLASDLNYAFSFGTGALRIDPKALTGVLTANGKTYDGTTAATGSITLGGVIAGDTVSASASYAFDDRNAGAGRVVTASNVTLSGADAGNYTVTVGSGVADILKRALTGVLTIGNKTYDGTTTATGGITLNGVIAGDTVSAGGAYAFADRNAGSGILVTASGVTLTGADAGNYTVTVGNGVADILRRAVTVTALDVRKAFGAADPLLAYRISGGGLVAGDSFTGALSRAPGELPGAYGILQGNLALSSNYDLTFNSAGAQLTIAPLPFNDPQGSSFLRPLGRTGDFNLDQDPSAKLATDADCPDENCLR